MGVSVAQTDRFMIGDDESRARSRRDARRCESRRTSTRSWLGCGALRQRLPACHDDQDRHHGGPETLRLDRHTWQDGEMSQDFGGESPRAHNQMSYRKPARYLIVIDSGGVAIARLFLDTRELVAEFDAGTEEAARMAAGLVPTKGADGPDWDRALEGHSAAERRAADVYTLDV